MNEKSSLLVPTVIEQEGRYERAFDIYSRLLKDRIVFLGTDVNETSASLIIAQLLFLENQDQKKDIMLYINSPGGSVSAGLAIYDTMRYIKPDISTVVVGTAASMGAFLASAGAKGKRLALPHSRMMIHQPLISNLSGQVTDIEIYADLFKANKKELSKLLAEHTGQKLTKIEQDVERDFWMTADEAKKYGLIDKVIPHS